MIGDEIAAALPELRAQAESLLTDSCNLQQPTGTTMDPTTGVSTTTWATYWSGPCRLATDAAGQGSHPVPGGVAAVSALTLSLPISASTPSVGHRALMGSGLALFVTGGTTGTQQVLQRIPVSREVVADRA